VISDGLENFKAAEGFEEIGFGNPFTHLHEQNLEQARWGPAVILWLIALAEANILLKLFT